MTTEAQIEKRRKFNRKKRAKQKARRERAIEYSQQQRHLFWEMVSRKGGIHIQF